MISGIVADDGAISHTLTLSCLNSESSQILPVDRAHQELQKHVQTWSKICCAGVPALLHTVADR